MLTLEQMQTLSNCLDDTVFLWSLPPAPFSWNDWGLTSCTQEGWDDEMPRVKFNYKLRMLVDEAENKGTFDGESLEMKNRRLNEARTKVKECLDRGERPVDPFGSQAVEKHVRSLARLHLRLFGHKPWDTWASVLNGSVNLEWVSDTDYDNAKQNQFRYNLTHAEQNLERARNKLDEVKRDDLEPSVIEGAERLVKNMEKELIKARNALKKKRI